MNDRRMIEATFRSWDGTELFYRHWPSASPSRKALVYLHRGHEHSGRIDQLVREFGLHECHAFAWDMRGHGHSPGPRGYAENFYDHVRDMNAFAQVISRDFDIPVENIVLVANSIGAVTAAAWVHDYAPRIRAMVLAAPAFRVRLYVPFTIPALRLLQRARKNTFVRSYVKSRMLTHDPEQIRAYDDDKLVSRDIAVNVLLGMHDLATRIIADAGAITTPTLILAAGSDRVVKNSAQRRFCERLTSAHSEMEVYAGFFHAILYEKDRHRPIARARQFIRESFENAVDREALLDADRSGYTREEYLRLCDKAPSWRALYFAAQKLGMRSLGRLSQGLRIGWSAGFNSGSSLDYVYENRAQGTTAIGRLIDRVYLDAPGWRAMRERQRLLEARLEHTLRSLVETSGHAHIVDIAAGAGRYILDILVQFPAGNVSALLRDRREDSLARGRQRSKVLRLESVAFDAADAFDRDSLRRVRPRPDIAVVSGLYELFPDNRRVLESLHGLADAVRPGGYLIYTCQPWHPQIEEIARTCVDWDGRPWIMRRRSQAEMDELVRSAGFDKIDMDIDSQGIATVSVARRRPEPRLEAMAC